MTPILEGLRTGAWRLVPVEATERTAPGPLAETATTYRCVGCPALRTEEWEFYGENDERDSGTSAKCTAIGKHISSYWYARDKTPEWCPALSALSASPDATAALLAEIEGLRGAVAAVTDATSSYPPPDGISAPECISRVIAATDNPEINAIMIGDRNGTP